MRSSARAPWWLGPASWCGATLVRLLAFTWRFEIEDAPQYHDAFTRGERFVFAFWHCGILPLTLLHRGEGVAVLVSRHHDGELIARIIHRLGYVTARGSSTRGGEQGVLELLAFASAGRHLAITPDGPRGPAERVKHGTVYIAARSGLRVVPIALGVRAAWRLRSWDRFRVPWPLARLSVSHGAPITVGGLDEHGGEQDRIQIEAALTALSLETRRRAGEPA